MIRAQPLRRRDRVVWFAMPMTVGILAAAFDPSIGASTRALLAGSAAVHAWIFQMLYWASNTANYFEPPRGLAFRSWARWVFAWAVILALAAAR